MLVGKVDHFVPNRGADGDRIDFRQFGEAALRHHTDNIGKYFICASTLQIVENLLAHFGGEDFFITLIDLGKHAKKFGMVGNDEKVQWPINADPRAMARMHDRQAFGKAIGGVGVSGPVAQHIRVQ